MTLTSTNHTPPFDFRAWKVQYEYTVKLSGDQEWQRIKAQWYRDPTMQHVHAGYVATVVHAIPRAFTEAAR